MRIYLEINEPAAGLKTGKIALHEQHGSNKIWLGAAHDFTWAAKVAPDIRTVSSSNWAPDLPHFP